MIIKYDFDYGEYEYEIDDSNVEDTIDELIREEYLTESSKKDIHKFLNDFDMYDNLKDVFYDDLYEYYKNDAFDEYSELSSFNSMYDYYGVSEKEF